jgi:hypothetical protein
MPEDGLWLILIALGVAIVSALGALMLIHWLSS